MLFNAVNGNGTCGSQFCALQGAWGNGEAPAARRWALYWTWPVGRVIVISAILHHSRTDRTSSTPIHVSRRRGQRTSWN
jgi:hypothetical protein